MKFLKDIFQPVGADQVRESQLFEARRLMLEHKAAAEYHEALALMYRTRVERLQIEAEKVGTGQ